VEGPGADGLEGTSSEITHPKVHVNVIDGVVEEVRRNLKRAGGGGCYRRNVRGRRRGMLERGGGRWRGMLDRGGGNGRIVTVSVVVVGGRIGEE